MSSETYQQRKAFFRLAIQNFDGYMCISLLKRHTKQMSERWFHVPAEFDKMLNYIASTEAMSSIDVYFCPQLFSPSEANGELRRTKDAVTICPTLWADLDTCPPSALELKPSLLTETSPGRYQGLWVVEGGVEPKQAAELSKRIAYQYADRGADRSGWDLTQLLRVPGTVNTKYVNTESGPVVVRVIGDAGYSIYRIEEFAGLPEVTLADYEQIPYPEVLPEGGGKQMMEKYRFRLTQTAWDCYETIPEEDWSRAMFKLEMLCFEAGMSREEAFVVMLDAACNKFKRNHMGPEHTWLDICRTWAKHNDNENKLVTVEKPTQPLLTEDERVHVKDVRTFVEEYIDWASSLGDAATQYHQGGAFVILSALLAGAVSLPTSFGRVLPNLWFMILADTTLTRKSTAMDIAIDLLADVDTDAIMATDGSIEGLMQGLSTRPGRPSIFLKDEFSGLLDQIAKKDYYAGMAETLTKLYDGKLQKRMLRKETIEVRDPVLIVFAGGIKNRVQQLLRFDHVSSGFIPRFLFLTATSDITRMAPLGPPTDLDTSGRDALLDVLKELHDFYHDEEVFITDGKKMRMPKRWNAELTPEAWKRYNKFERDMLQAGLDSSRSDLMTPLYDRLAKSALKATILLSASRQRRDDTVVIEVDDILLGIKYAEGWRDYAIDVVNGIGRGLIEGQIDNILGNIKRNPGISRAKLMNAYHLSAREADAVFATLEQRGLVTRRQVGRGFTYYSA